MIPRTTQPQTLIEKLEKQRDAWFEQHKEYGDREARSCGYAIDECIDIVKQHSEWVPCSERMPNDGENVLFHSIHSRTVSLGCRNKYGREYLWDITDSCGYELDRNISHWQPLPQPPSEAQEKIYQQEMDKIKFCACGCILPDYLTQCSDCEALDE